MLKANNYTTPLRRLASLYLENGRLLLTEKLTIILSGMAIGLISIGLGIITVMFIGFGFAAMLRNVMDPFWAYAIVAGVFLLMVVSIFIFRQSLIINPIARMLSKTLLPDPTAKATIETNDNPENNDDNEDHMERI